MERIIYRIYSDSREKIMKWSDAEKLTNSFVLDSNSDHFPVIQHKADYLSEEEATAAIKSLENILELYPYHGSCLAHMTVFYVAKEVETLDEDDSEAEWELDLFESELYYMIANGMRIERH